MSTHHPPRAFSVILGLSALALLGYFLLPQLSIRWQPGPLRGSLSVSYSWPGADPATLEQELTAPLEAGFALLRNVDGIKSVSRRGGGRIDLEVNPAADQDFVRFTVASTIRRLYPAFPVGASYPTIDFRSSAANDNDQAEQPVLTYTLSGPDPPTKLFRYAREQLAPRLSLRPGLSRIDIGGGNQAEYLLQVDPEQLRTAGLDRSTLTSQLRAYFNRSGLGILNVAEQSRFAFLADVATDTLSLSRWAAIPLTSPRSRSLTLGDLAQISLVEAAPTAYYRVNGRNNLRLLVYPTPAANQLELASNFQRDAQALRPTLPAGYELLLENDNTEYLREELTKTRQRTALSMGILLLFVLLIYRSWRQLFLIFFSLAVNLGLALLLYFLIGVELNLYAFAGIAVSFGIMVDNVIIMLDALRRRSADTVAPAILGATLTTMAGLSVIWFLGEELRHQLFELARVMIINLATSLLVAIYLVPALGRYFLPAEVRQTNAVPTTHSRAEKFYTRLLNGLLRFRKTALLLAVLAFGLPVFWLPRSVPDWPLYNRTIGSDYYQDEWRPLVNRWLGGSFRLFSNYVYEGSGYRPPEETRLYVSAALPDGATVHQLSDVLARVEAYLATFQDKLTTYVTRVNSGQNGRIQINFPDNGRGGFPYQLKGRLSAYAVNFGGVEWNIYGVGPGYSNSSGSSPVGFRVELKGYAQDELDRQSARLAELLLKHPRVNEVDTDANVEWWQRSRSEFLLAYDPAALAMGQRSATQLNAALNWFNRAPTPDLRLPNGLGVLIRADRPAEYDRWNLENRSLPVDSVRLNFARLGQLTRREAPQSLHKEDQQYLRLVSFEYLGSSRFGSRHLNNCLDTLRAELPLGFTAERGSYSRNEVAKQWTALMGLAVLLIFFICALLFESLSQALAIVLLIPFSFIGVFLTFYLFGVRLDQGGYTSFLLVTGLSVNGIILIVNEFNRLRKMSPLLSSSELYVSAFGHKIRPIVLTVISTAAGLVPFLLGGEQEVFWYGLAAGTIGGLVFSILLLTLLCPLFLLRTSRRGV